MYLSDYQHITHIECDVHKCQIVLHIKILHILLLQQIHKNNKMNMKKITIALFLVLCLLGNVHSRNLSLKEKKATQVTLHGVPAKQPRNGIEVTIDCFYYDGILCLNFSEQVQNASISVIQTATGEDFYTDQLDCNKQSISLDVPQSPGLYYVIIQYETKVLYGYYTVY